MCSLLQTVVTADELNCSVDDDTSSDFISSGGEDEKSSHKKLLTRAELALESYYFKFNSVSKGSSDSCLHIHRFTANRKC